jgi:hypothetical protein
LNYNSTSTALLITYWWNVNQHLQDIYCCVRKLLVNEKR